MTCIRPFLPRRNTVSEGAWRLSLKRLYRQLETYVAMAPERFQQLFPHMRTHNGGQPNQYARGIERSFAAGHRAAYMPGKPDGPCAVDRTTLFTIGSGSFSPNWMLLSAVFGECGPGINSGLKQPLSPSPFSFWRTSMA